MYSVDTAIQKNGFREWKVSLFCDGEWRTSFHRSIDDARDAVRELLKKFGAKVGR
jgi:hypothetical protein